MLTPSYFTRISALSAWGSRRAGHLHALELVDFALDLGVENGFIQEGPTAKESFIPAFDGEGLR